jgi:hypothetical protein
MVGIATAKVGYFDYGSGIGRFPEFDTNDNFRLKDGEVIFTWTYQTYMPLIVTKLARPCNYGDQKLILS